MKDMNARDFGWKFNGELSVRLFHTLIQRPISEFSLKQIQQKEFLRQRNVGIKTWNEFVEIRNDYFNNWKKNKTKNTIKTAMQELRCLVQSMAENGGDDDLWAVLSHIDDKLEKEKEQIINAHNNAVISPYTELYVHKIQGKSPITKGEQYYNQNFNQNK